MTKKLLEMQKGFQTAFIDASYDSNLAYKPEFVYNDNKNGQKVFSTIEDELLHCDRFAISVAFITRGGVTPLLQTLQELERRGVPGRILITDYLCFSDPVALTTLAGLTNIELRMYQTEKAGNGFHTKGYIFQEQEEYRFIIGSSNLTQDALTRNMEWNTKLISTDQGEMIKSVMGEFDKLWNAKEYTKSYEDFIDEYQRQYEEKQLFQKMVAEQKRIAKNEVIPSIQSYSMQPNMMQKSFVYNLRNLRKQGIDKALLISATGTGKTYASAFAMRELGFKRVLFLVHRNQIAKQAKKSFENVFGSRIKTGLVSGAYHDYDAEFVFATVQTLSKDEHLQNFSKDYFDACIYDEAHHTSANSYKKVMDYFTPQFTLGMTATPDKRDDNMEGRNIYEIFHHNIAYEIRLQQAMEEDLLCPFHYFGITDLQTVSDAGKSHEEQLEHFRYLTCDDRVNYVMKQANYFGYSGDRVKGLIFCSRIDEARELSRKFNERGWRTLVLSGADSEEARAEAIERLVMDVTSEEDDYLDYLITVDIFSEGTDIVEVNQVIMLRPTQSPIVFVQQLGRGLRKHSEKEYVVILDFIGNYKNNFMIPIALSGDRTYNKDTIRRYVMEGARVIPGSSSIHFDEISKKRIYEAIDKLSTPKKMLIEKYTLLKERLGKVPSIVDFYVQGEVDPLLFIQYAGSYPKFLQMAEKNCALNLSDKEHMTLEFVSQNIVNGNRVYELLLLRQLMQDGRIDKEKLTEYLQREYCVKLSDQSYESAISVLQGHFFNTQTEKKKYEKLDILVMNNTGVFSRMLSLYSGIKKSDFLNQLNDLIELGVKRYTDLYLPLQDELGLSLYQKYSRKDVCRILNWEQDESSTIYGYKIKYNTCPIFVTYEKKNDIASSTKYEDEFINNQVFSWMTRSRVSADSIESRKLIASSDSGLKILLFVKKSDGEGTDFYYMGRVHPIAWEQKEIYNDKGIALPIMNFRLKLEHSVREDIYQYFVCT